MCDTLISTAFPIRWRAAPRSAANVPRRAALCGLYIHVPEIEEPPNTCPARTRRGNWGRWVWHTLPWPAIEQSQDDLHKNYQSHIADRVFIWGNAKFLKYFSTLKAGLSSKPSALRFISSWINALCPRVHQYNNEWGSIPGLLSCSQLGTFSGGWKTGPGGASSPLSTRDWCTNNRPRPQLSNKLNCCQLWLWVTGNMEV